MFLCLKTCSYVKNPQPVPRSIRLHHRSPFRMLIVEYIITSAFHDVVELPEQVPVARHFPPLQRVPVRQDLQFRCRLQSPAHPHPFLPVRLLQRCALSLHPGLVDVRVLFLQCPDRMLPLSVPHILPHPLRSLAARLAHRLPPQAVVVPVLLALPLDGPRLTFLDPPDTSLTLRQSQLPGKPVQRRMGHTAHLHQPAVLFLREPLAHPRTLLIRQHQGHHTEVSHLPRLGDAITTHPLLPQLPRKRLNLHSFAFYFLFKSSCPVNNSQQLLNPCS